MPWPRESWRSRSSRCRSGGRGFAESEPGGACGQRARGPAEAGLVLTDAERDQLGRWARRAKTSQALALRAKNRAGLRRRPEGQQGRRRRAAGGRAHGGAVARRPRRRKQPGRPDRRAAPRTAAVDPAGAGSRRSSPQPWRRCRGTPPTGPGPRWPGAGRPVEVHGQPDQPAKSTSSRTFIDGFKLSTDPLFVAKVVDVVGLYHNPRRRPSSCAWTRSPRSRPWTGPSRCCR